MCGGGSANQAAAQQAAQNTQIVSDVQNQTDAAVSGAGTTTTDILAQQRAEFDARSTLQEERYNQLVADTSAQNAALLNSFTTQMGQWTQSAAQQATTQQSAMQEMMNSIREGQMSASAELERQRKNTGQKAKTANLGELMRQNKAKMAKGNGGTMLTGLGGVAPADLNLGAPALLGA